jgi:hypothetical protein
MIEWRQYRDSNYYVSNTGLLKTTNWKNTGKEKIMSPDNSEGYMRTVIVLNSVKKSIRVHRLVAEVFIPNPLNKEYVNHKNGIKNDNRVENLELVTHQENITHAYKELNVRILRGSEIGNAKIDERIAKEIKDSYIPNKRGFRKEMAVKYGVSESLIKCIVSGRTWKHIK